MATQQNLILPWVMGAFLWKAVTIPVISLERLVNRVNPSANSHTRIVVVTALGHNPKLNNFGFSFLGIPVPKWPSEAFWAKFHSTGSTGIHKFKSTWQVDLVCINFFRWDTSF